jgi:RND family efflux transporter MFP subunit
MAGADAPKESVFRVDPKRQQLIGVRTAAVTTRSLDNTISTIGRVGLDERRIVHVHTKFSGWISKVFVDFQWQHVRKGDPLFTVYSPDLVATQEEYLLALKANSTLGKHSLQEVAGGAHSLLQAARRRLELWDISDAQINRLDETGEIQKDLTVYSPAEGHITERKAFENMRIEPGTELYTIADHSVVWVQVEVYENDIPFVRMGQRATMTVESFPGRRFAGRVAYVEPHVMEQTRTLRVRLEFANPDLTLKPGMYADVTLAVPGATVVAVPESAVLRTGEQDIVFVDHGQGRMELRRIQLGRRAGDYYEVLRGLTVGEDVVVAGNFLIDAESKVQGAVANWEGEPQP